MGQRANYILIEENKQVIHYNHWRANSIASDLYLGEKRFIEFVKDCKIVDVLLNEVWMEGCVVIDIDRTTLYFWSFEFGITSATDFYLKELQVKWQGWSINRLYNKMYDVEKILNIDYISNQELHELSNYTKYEIIDDTAGEWVTATIIIKTESKVHVAQTGDINVGGILNFGESIVEILLSKPSFELPKEADDNVYECIVIDTIKKEVILDKSEFGLLEQTLKKWDCYKFEMGDIGYIGALKRAEIDTDKLSMSTEKVKEEFANMIARQTDFSPVEMAKRLLTEDKDIKFSPDFFDSVNPKKTFFEKIKGILTKIIKQRSS
jgi:hypothetical protein